MKHIPPVAPMLLFSFAMLGMSGAAFSAGSEKAPEVAPVENQQYQKECGSCHFAFQPGLLPARSWTKLMASLENHFEENAELSQEDARVLTNYLQKNAADTSRYKRSKKIMKSLRPDDVPLRISEIPYFVKKHRELKRKMVQDNPKVGSLSKCEACHTKADKGSFRESEIRIPGFGAWED